jgi:hypothetical protein
MGFFMLKNWITPCLILSVVVTNLPILPEIVNNIVIPILRTNAVICNGLIFMYYASLPTVKKTILHQLMQFLMIANIGVLMNR